VDPLDVDRVATSGEITDWRVVVEDAVCRGDGSEADDLGELADRLERGSTAGAGIAGAGGRVSDMADPGPAGDAFEVGDRGLFPVGVTRPIPAAEV